MKGKFILLTVVFMFVLSGCQEHETSKFKKAPFSTINLNTKKSLLEIVNNERDIRPIEVKSINFSAVCEWFDNEHVLYLKNEDGKFKLVKYSLFEETEQIFYQASKPIVSVKANVDHSLFAIHLTDSLHETSLLILNKEGKIVNDWHGISYDLQTVWNPYQTGQLMVTSFSADWDFKVFIMDSLQTKTYRVPLDFPYLQWVDSNTLAYLDWSDEPEYAAPLYLYHIDTQKKEKWQDQVIAFFSFKGVFMTVTLDQTSKQRSVYTFYDSKTRQQISVFQLPPVNTYSENWWIPNHDYVWQTNSLYFIQPPQINKQTNSYELVKYHVGEQIKTDVYTTLKEDTPINMSPNGEMGLLGYRFEKLFDTVTDQFVDLIESY